MTSESHRGSRDLSDLEVLGVLERRVDGGVAADEVIPGRLASRYLLELLEPWSHVRESRFREEQIIARFRRKWTLERRSVSNAAATASLRRRTIDGARSTEVMDVN